MHAREPVVGERSAIGETSAAMANEEGEASTRFAKQPEAKLPSP